MKMNDIKIRNDWGNIKPATKVIQSKKNRKEKQIIKKEMELIGMKCIYDFEKDCTGALECSAECFEGDMVK